MLNFSFKKTAAILAVCLFGVFFALLSFVPKESVPSWFPHPQVNLGLDLQGGTYVLLQADKPAVMKERMDNSRAAIQQALRAERIPYRQLVARGDSVSFSLVNPEESRKARDAIREIINTRSGSFQNMLLYDFTEENGNFTLKFNEEGSRDLMIFMTDKALEIVRRRVDSTGVAEPVIARSGEDRIIVELPGLSDPNRLKNLLGSTAKMTFHLVVEGQTTPDAETQILPEIDPANPDLPTGRSIAVRRQVELDGSTLTNAAGAFDSQSGQNVVTFQFDTKGARAFQKITTEHIGERFAIVLDGKVISAPVVRTPILGGSGQIEGGYRSLQEAEALAILLRSGALPVPLQVIQERVIGASLGADSIRAGLISVSVGFILVVVIMLLTYGRFGVYAATALIVNLAMTITVLAILGGTLTLPGIAGILLALGVAVDSNVLINERTREEVKKKKGVINALETGFSRAYTTILDANITTFLKMAILWAVTTGTVRGFALTISLGLLISMFTAVEFVRLLVAKWVRRARPKELTIGFLLRRLLPERTSFSFMNARYWGLAGSAALSTLSIILLMHPGLKMGVDFAGGTVVEVQFVQDIDLGQIRQSVNAIGIGNVQVQQFGSPRDVALRFESKDTAAERDAAVAQLRTELEKIAPIRENGLSVSSLDASVGSELFTQGLIALALAAVVMFIYIAWRFEWPFGVGSIATLFLDVTKTLGFYALFQFEFNLTSIAAILTIMGFSINDKIVVYDRVRENLKLYKTMPLRQLIDLSINEVISRTIITGLTTLAAIGPLVFYGGPALFEFAVVLVFGLILATSSSIVIAAPILLFLGEHRLRPAIVAASAKAPKKPKAGVV
ncbi:MAG: protein translocase subunit SecD [Methylobacteriaceae bacterium]|jgi:SecD/SecF fusion protein|nr:protein translocase subunit SecD [Methylobacteriaceae bacterium]